MNETSQSNRVIKNALLKVYAPKDVSVRGDRGTAYGWVNVKVTLDRPEGCECKIVTKEATWAKVPYTYSYREQLDPKNYQSSYYCEKCLALLKENQEKVDKIVYGCGAEFGHYCVDDGYNTEQSEVITTVEIR